MMAAMLSGCSSIGDKAASISVIYCVTTVLSFVLLATYCATIKKRDVWYLLLFSSVLVVNIGYFALAKSANLNQALVANRISYLGSVFLPLSMCMIILNVTRIRYKRWLPAVLLILGGFIFLIAASPGYLDIYYKEVTFQKINGVTVLQKVYGPLHISYLLYLMVYFSVMVAVIVCAVLKRRIESATHATILAMAVFINIGVWLVEQLVRIDFEILSVSYVISEVFLLGLKQLMAEAQRHKEENAVFAVQDAAVSAVKNEDSEYKERAELFLTGLERLTPKEQQLYDCYITGMSTAEIMKQLCIKENTLKFHSKNLYSKLGVRSRKQLVQMQKQCSSGAK